MTARALHSFSFAVDVLRIHGLDNGGVTTTARSFYDPVIEPGDLNRVRIFSGGEVKRMKETVSSFHRVFADKVVRRVTVIARRHRMMTGLEPTAVLVIHYMAVGTCTGIIEEIRVAFGVNERVAANPDDDADQNQQDKVEHGQTHVALC